MNTQRPKPVHWRQVAIPPVAVGATGVVICHLWHFCECGHMAHDSVSVWSLHC
jgi:hypothetical protein